MDGQWPLVSAVQPPFAAEARTPAQWVGNYLTEIWAVTSAELTKLRHDPNEIFTRAIQPALWLVLFGEVMAQVRGLSTSGHYLDFLAPGILAQSVLFAAIFYGIGAIWERDLGVLHRYMVSPAPRSALVLGRAVSSAVRGLVQAVVVYILSALLGISLNLNPLNLLGVILLIALGAGLFSTFSLIIACLVKTRERFMGVGQGLTMPIFFASNAIYPIEIMPKWLQVVSRANPLSYEVDAVRALMINGQASHFGLGLDVGVLVVVFAVMVAIATRLYPRLTQ